MRTVFLTIPYALRARDILRSQVFATLRSSQHRIVLLSPAYDDADFVAEFAAPNVVFEPLPTRRPSVIEERLRSLRYALFADKVETFRIATLARRRRGLLKEVLRRIVLGLAAPFGTRRLHEWLMWMDTRVMPEPHYSEIFRRYRPAVVCTTFVLNWAPDYLVLRRATRERVPSVVLVSSWDNLTSKGVFPNRADRLVVWNETMRAEAAEVHGYDPACVFVAGAPQFDVYADQAALPSRDAFFASLGLDAARRLITYTTANMRVFPTEPEVVDIISRLLADGAFGRGVQLLVRLHPRDSLAPYAFLWDRSGVKVDQPGRIGRFEDRDLSSDDLRHLAATMKYSDVVVNAASTTTIDAAAFDTPVVCVAFDGHAQRPYAQSVERHFDFTHYRKLASAGGFRRADSPEDLRAWVCAYLDDPGLDREGRRETVRQQCYRLDGKAGERIGRYLLGLVDGTAPPAG